MCLSLYLQVANWGSGEHSALGDLQVKSYSPRLAVADASKPLYELIVHQLQLAEVRGTWLPYTI